MFWTLVSTCNRYLPISINSLVHTEQILMVAVDNRLLCREMNEGCTRGTDATSCSAIVNSAVSAIMSLAELNVCSYTPGEIQAISALPLHLSGCYLLLTMALIVAGLSTSASGTSCST